MSCSRIREAGDDRNVEVDMVQSRTVQVVQTLLGLGLLAGMLFVRTDACMRVAWMPTGGVRPDIAVNMYRRRIEMTQTLLRTNQLDMATRH